LPDSGRDVGESLMQRGDDGGWLGRRQNRLARLGGAEDHGPGAEGDRVIDLSAVTRCDSSAVAALIAWRRAAAARGASLEIVGGPRALSSLAVVYGVDELVQGATAP
jgi:ABC-type transporter Mla MlaB component